MNLLDRYIARNYLLHIAVLLVLLACFVVMVDVSLNLARYWKIATEVARASGHETGTPERILIMVLLVADLWWPRLLGLFNAMLGVVLVGAMGFTCAQMSRQRELTAMLAGGISLFRVARPILLVALGMTGLQIVNAEVLLPRLAPLLTRDAGDAGRRAQERAPLPPTVDAHGRVFYGRRFDADRGVIEDLYVWERDEQGLATRRLHAEQARWHAGAWYMTGVTVESRGGTPAGNDAAPTTLVTDLDPAALAVRRHAGFGPHLSWRQIREMLARLEQNGNATEQARQQRERLIRLAAGRAAGMVSHLLVLLMALPFFLTRTPGNMLAQSLKCAPVAIASLVAPATAPAMNIPRLPPAVSAFVPVMILLPLAIAMLARIRT